MRAPPPLLVSSDTKSAHLIGLFGEVDLLAYRAEACRHKDLVCKSVFKVLIRSSL